MMKVIDFKQEHLNQIKIQPKQAYLMPYTATLGEFLETQVSFSAVDEGEIKACAGIMALSPNRGLMWSYLSRNLKGKGMLRMTKWAKIFLDDQDFERIEAHIDCDFPQAHRWAKMLGFELECPRMRKYGVTGKDVAMYVRIQE